MTDRDDHATSVAAEFADALDRDDYEAAREFLTDETIYTIHGKLYIGADEVLDRYRRSAEWAASSFEQVDYDSSVEPLEGNRVEVTFVDHITHGDESLDLEARQVLTIDTQLEVVDRIKHRDYQGEDERIEEFFQKTGVDRPSVSWT
jgi:hypothetical protein